MRIKMLSLAAGPNGVLRQGATVDIEPNIARPLIDGGFALPIDEPTAADEEPTEVEDEPDEEQKPKLARKKRK